MIVDKVQKILWEVIDERPTNDGETILMNSRLLSRSEFGTSYYIQDINTALLLEKSLWVKKKGKTKSGKCKNGFVCWVSEV